ncbi:alpha-aminoadipate reductase phosphopantetheinyl transferase Lys7 [Schizosaccharomyces cryophilus OY26]|uniref:holo-[acyl-carrier-protein] synthase n=1 Tax=Schizosaccharomyces cryophilus (strain OY26 / ATCC MYA-4695 / CBS 11777 / NBRC 106824 / NRRL Y48691) TaxID=653667 RepID=S9W333_SCHCR|nr:alpha-aminoadipate reductase phosphopantetheinyl transferase Lys7 [Schizosaccharomyces cryophilus OY26]EPY52355.1 alpha-aminoadipate reductase phosphopantetheinyl transferase Lys7 [Schizosaccharomyces cryophilus OY26]
MASSVVRILVDTQTWSDQVDSSSEFHLLLPEEKSQVKRYYFAKDANMAMASMLVKRQVLATLFCTDPESVRLSVSENGRPYYPKEVSQDTIFDFNVSHYGGMVVFAGIWVSKNSSSSMLHQNKIGIDIVECKPLTDQPNWMDDFEFVFSREQWSRVLSYSDPLAAFFLFWACKEAVLKSLGLGLHGNPALVELQIPVFQDLVYGSKLCAFRAGTASYLENHFRIELHRKNIHGSIFFIAIAYPVDHDFTESDWLEVTSLSKDYLKQKITETFHYNL